MSITLGQLKLLINQIPDEYNDVKVIAQADDEGNYYQDMSGISVEKAREDEYRTWTFYEEGYHDEDDLEEMVDIAVVW